MENISDIINSDSVIQRAHKLNEMTSYVRHCLPPPVDKHCWVGGYDKTVLSLVTDSSAYCTLIYIHHHQILKQFNAQFKTQTGHLLRKIKVRVSNHLLNAPNA